MKKIFVILGFIGVVHVAFGINHSDGLLSLNRIGEGGNTDLLLAMDPIYTEMEGNLFLALKTKDPVKIEDGDVVEFIFDRQTKMISFHINDTNQDLIDTGMANLFVMIHHDLALELRSRQLKKIVIKSNGKTYTVPVNSFWTPDRYLSTL